MIDEIDVFFSWVLVIGLVLLVVAGFYTYDNYSQNNKCKALGYDSYVKDYRQSPAPYCYKIINGNLEKYYLKGE